MRGTAGLLRTALPPRPGPLAEPGPPPRLRGTGPRGVLGDLLRQTPAPPHAHRPSVTDLLTQARLPARDHSPPVTTPGAPAREAAKRELSKRMYHDGEPNLLVRALNHFWEWLERLFGAASGVSPGGGLGLVVIILAVLALAALLWWRLGTPRRTSGTSVPAAPLFDDHPRSAAEHRATAAAHAGQGRWTQAVQERMRAVLRALEERALLTPRPGRTADEAATEAAAALPAYRDRLHAAAQEFDGVTYGGRTGDEASYHRLSALDDDLANARPVLRPSGTSGSSRP